MELKVTVVRMSKNNVTESPDSDMEVEEWPGSI